MIQQKFEKGTPVFFFAMMNKIPGVVLRAEQSENGEWIYEIAWGSDMVAKNVPERHIRHRSIVDLPKYNWGDLVRFYGRDQELTGRIEIVDAYGTFEQDEEPSYDIYVEEENCLYKHIRESLVLGKAM